MIAAISNDFFSARQLSNNSILNWNKTYALHEQYAKRLGVNIIIGTLFNEQNKGNLILDFCEKSGFQIKENCIVKKK